MFIGKEVSISLGTCSNEGLHRFQGQQHKLVTEQNKTHYYIIMLAGQLLIHIKYFLSLAMMLSKP